VVGLQWALCVTVAFAATVITTLPMVVVFLIAQRSFVRGLAGSGVD
jgi:ABC-type glycerol-3-phosphate transport system permease component